MARATAVLGALALLTLAGCASRAPSAPDAGSGGPSNAAVHVVAAEDFYGSIAVQLAGDRAQVRSIITDPNGDPHDYEPGAADARLIAGAQLVISDGIGYDPWIRSLLGASPASGRIDLSAGALLGLRDGDNPHRWYSPPDVERIADAITSALTRLDAKDAKYFRARRARFDAVGLARYHRLIADIRRRYRGVAVGASESIFALLAPALGLRLITPPRYMTAISEGSDPTSADTTTVTRQIDDRQIKVWVYNAQNATPDIKRLNQAAASHGIPVATVTETLTPRGASFEDWQARQLAGLEAALHRATGR